MPLNTDLNVPPYFDDYDEANSYYRILFKPQQAVQARELTQVQSILQNQIERFGNWAFKNGDIVDGCPIIDLPRLDYVRLSDTASNSSSTTVPYDPRAFINAFAVSLTSNLTARVLSANIGYYAYYPNTNIVYLQYVNTGNNGATKFANNEPLQFYIANTLGNTALANVNTLSNTTSNTTTTGKAHGISVGVGTVFINGEFVKVQTPTIGIVNAYGIYAGNNVVGFQLQETIINSNQDASLLDNALGYSNYNAPGADRLKLTPTLLALDPTTASNTAGFNPIAQYNFGSLVTKALSCDVYSVVGNAISQRIYDEAGNYVVNPFVVDTVTSTTGNSIITSVDANTVLGRVSPGVGYSRGERVEILKTAYINMRRGIDTTTLNSQQISFNFGNYFTATEVTGGFPFNSGTIVNLYDQPQTAVTSKNFNNTSPSGNVIGTAIVRDFTYLQGTAGSNTAQYAVHVYNIKLTSSSSLNIKSIGNTSYGFADVNPNLVGSQNGLMLFGFGQSGLKNLRDKNNNLNTEYVYGSSNTAVLTSSGNVTISITSSATGGVDYLPYGTGALPQNDLGDITLVSTNTVSSSNLSGNVSIYNTNNAVVGNGTNFLQYFIPGDLVTVSSQTKTVTSVTNATFMSVDSVFSSSLSGQNFVKTYANGKIIPIGISNPGYSQSNVYVTNSTSFTINTGLALSSASSVRVFYPVLRTSTVPARKVINKNRFVKIQVSNNTNGPHGPWSLGYTDVHKITAVYGSSDGSYNLSNPNVTNQFVFDTGQTDYYYGPGMLYPTGSYNSSNYPYLLVQLDYFTVNTTPGIGLFTVESYPIDDANTANTNAIQTKDIPLYIDGSGNSRWLRDYVDFRVPGNNQSTDTGSISIANSSQVTTAIAAATVNPSISFVPSSSIPAGGWNPPQYGKNLQSDITSYLPRTDLITITPDNLLKVVEGRSAQAPQAPLFPDNSMTLATINVPVYPSLSTDQIDADQAINKLSKNLIRDTSTAITVNLVENRRYTMADIGKLDSRISSLEYYAQLTTSQQKASSLVVTDSNGLNRFKNGIFVDNFTSFLSSCVANPEYSVAIDEQSGIARPKFILDTFRVNFSNTTSTNSQQTGRAITLPYTSIKFFSQPYATEYMSAAPVQFHWNGNMRLAPSYDNNICQTSTASVNITQCNVQPWKQFANTPFGSVWGSWNTTTNTNKTTVQVGTVCTTYIVVIPPIIPTNGCNGSEG